MTPNFVVVVNVLLIIRYHIGSGTPNLRIFVEDNDALLGGSTDKSLNGCESLLVARIRK